MVDVVLITGGAGFIGSALCRQILAETDDRIVNLDKLTYAANPASIGAAPDDPRHRLEVADIADRAAVVRIFREHRPARLMHLAAESHVDRSITAPDAFIATNVVGTYTLLDVARLYWDELEGAARARFRFHHVSTDEVFGALGPSDPPFTEDSPRRPRSPYAASKAASDHLVASWAATYGLPTILSNCSNNYGPCQFPEKLVPRLITQALRGESLPVYGTGENVRDWLHVEDHARALRRISAEGRTGACYAIGGGAERRNIDVVHSVCAILARLLDRPPHRSFARQIRFVPDRPGHDFRYAVDDRRVRAELGWAPEESFESGLENTVRWYLDNRSWWDGDWSAV